MGRIVDIQIERLQKLLEDRKIAITLDGKAREWLAEKGYDPAYGARPLKRVIQKSVQDPLAEFILSGRIKDGEKVAISAGRNGLVFNGARRCEEQSDEAIHRHARRCWIASRSLPWRRLATMHQRGAAPAAVLMRSRMCSTK